MGKMTFVRGYDGFRPAPECEVAERFLNRVKMGEVVTVEARKPRSVQHHRLLFAVLSKVKENLSPPLDTESLLDLIKIRTGHVTVFRTVKGEVVLPKSIAFDAMDQAEFHAFFDQAVDFICREIIPGLDPQELINEGREMIGQRSFV